MRKRVRVHQLVGKPVFAVLLVVPPKHRISTRLSLDEVVS